MQSNLVRSCLVALVLTASLALVGAGRASESTPSGSPEPGRDVHILIAYFTLSSNTAHMAEGVAEGVKKVPGARVTCKKVEEVSKSDLEAAAGIILGCPTYYGTIPGRMKVVMDDWSWKMKVDFTDKVGGAFSTGGGQTGGKEFVVVSLLMFMLNNRMVVAGPLYRNDRTGSVWAEAGASAMTGPLDPGVGEGELEGARRLGERIARLARKAAAPLTP